ncbi:hypothetical protein E2C01_036444 [Portunus trituberculatus]|uniref:Uncharacterized protein n=1 Tax=Portunus trituberculatus TaxID=210409 RepID=A0A5B7F8Q7_PORTR|nr:hypothetical protein [Portunus trituberculatus]
MEGEGTVVREWWRNYCEGMAVSVTFHTSLSRMPLLFSPQSSASSRSLHEVLAGEGEEALELQELDEEEEEEEGEDSVVRAGGGGGLKSDGGEECDLDSVAKEFDKVGDLRAAGLGENVRLGAFGDSRKTMESGRTGDFWRRVKGEMLLWVVDSGISSSVCRRVGDKDGAGDVAGGRMVLELGDKGPRGVAFRVGI